jgi:hypothetical protein
MYHGDAMNKLFATLALSFLIVGGHPASTPREFASRLLSRSNPPVALGQFVSKEGEFSVKLPGEPKLSSEDLDTAVGKVTLHSFAVETNSGNNAYMIAYSDYPTVSDAAGEIDGVINAQVSSFKGKIVADKKVTLNGWPGRTVRIEAPDTTCVSSAYMAGHRLYQVMFITVKTETLPTDVTEFLESFQISRAAPAK